MTHVVKDILKDLLDEVDKLYQDTWAAKVEEGIEETELKIAHDINEALETPATDTEKTPAARKRPISLASEEPVRKKLKFEDEEEESFSNMPGRRNPATFVSQGPKRSGSRGGMVGDEEVDVVPPPKRLALAAPDYFTIDLPYAVTGHRTTAKQNNPLTFFFRLNSIFDPQVTTLGTEHQPMGRDLWSGVYQYYRVLKSSINVTCANYTPNEAITGTTHPAFIFGISPQENTTNTLQTREALMESKISDWQIIHPLETNHHFGSLNFNYSPESWDFHVQESGIDERWTPIGANPAVSHYIGIHIANMFNGDVRALNAQLTVTMKFTVQFREANSSYIHTIDPS